MKTNEAKSKKKKNKTREKVVSAKYEQNQKKIQTHDCYKKTDNHNIGLTNQTINRLLSHIDRNTYE